jgi:hypothetical protein
LLDIIAVGADIPTWGSEIVSLGDHDGNGFPELAVAAPRFSLTVDTRYPEERDDLGWIGVYHLPDFRLIWSAMGRHHGTQFPRDHGDALGITLAAAGDLDGDGALDLFAGTDRTVDPAPSFLNPRYGRLYLYSGRTGEVLTVYEADHNLYEDRILGAQFADIPFFQVVTSLDDVDGDGHIDFLAGRPWNTNDARRIDNIGIVRAIRYRPTGPRFIRGDANGDGRVNIADAKKILLALLRSETPACEAACDLDGSRDIALDDGLYLLRSLFLPETGEPPPPYPECGRYDMVHPFIELGCEEEGTCAGN